MQVYRRIRDLREDHDKTQAEIASVLGIQQPQYARYENGTNEMPLRYFIILARYYGVSLDYLAGESDVPQKAH